MKIKKDFKYKSVFASKITKISNAEIKQYISTAGLEKLTPLLPKDIRIEDNPDLIGIVANAARVNIKNLNGDTITNKTAVAVAKNFVWKYVDADHKRSKILGVICNYGFSEVNSNKILTEEEVLKTEEPVNISLALLLWKIPLSDEFVELLEESCDESSDLYGNYSLSWEILFNDYDIAVGPNEVSKAKIVTDKEEKEKLKDKLQANGGTGKDGDNYVYRVIKGESENDFCLPSGVGIVESPAGRVKGLYIVNSNEANDKTSTCSSNTSSNNIELKFNCQSQEKEKTEGSLKTGVNNEDNKNNNSIKIMKINKISDITDESLKTMTANVIHDFLVESIKEGSKEYVEEKNKIEKTLSEVKANAEKEKAEKEENIKKLKEVTEKLNKIEAEIAEKKQQEAFNIRMEALDKEYDLSNEENKEFRAIIAKKIANLSDEDYKKFEEEAKVLYKEKSVAYKNEIKKKLEEAEAAKKAKEEKELKESKASTEEDKTNKEKVIDNAIDNANGTDGKIANAASAAPKNMKEKYAKAFADDQFEFVSRKGH